MEVDSQPSLSMRAVRRIDGNGLKSLDKDCNGTSPFSPERTGQDLSRMVWRRGFIRLVFVSVMVWMFLIVFVMFFHVWSCRSTIGFVSALCKKESKVLDILNTMGLGFEMQHRCPIPVADNPDSVVIPEKGTPNVLPQHLSYIQNDEVPISDGKASPLFGGHQSWKQREDSYKLNITMKVHCGFVKNGGAEMEDVDARYAQKCRFVVASGIFDGYDTPNQPSNISIRSQKLFCFLMVVDEISLEFIKKNASVVEDNEGGKWVGIWRLVTLHHPPYDEPRRNGKVPKILTHRLFPHAQYSIWIDGKMELMVDPLLILERYLWRGKHTFAIARHKHHKSIYEEADAIKRRKRYARPLIDLHMKIYRFEGMDVWSPMKGTKSDVPEGAVIVREHTALTNLFSCLWFNEVDLFTPRDQLSFGYVVYRLGDAFKFFMFPNCEFNSLFILHKHTREHSSKVEWVKSIDELKGKKSDLKESRGGLGLWTPYPGDLDSVQLPVVRRTSPAG